VHNCVTESLTVVSDKSVISVPDRDDKRLLLSFSGVLIDRGKQKLLEEKPIPFPLCSLIHGA
jgi:hypothetical protein